MRWRGESEAQWLRRTGEWHRVFCWVPMQMEGGNWVWLEYCWRIRRSNLRGGWFFEWSDETEQPVDLQPGPPPPKPKK